MRSRDRSRERAMKVSRMIFHTLFHCSQGSTRAKKEVKSIQAHQTARSRESTVQGICLGS